MRRTLLLLLLSIYAPLAFSQSQDLERIIHYDVVITADTSGGLFVLEKLKVNVKGEEIKRGIFRTLPSRRNINHQNIAVKYDIISVTKNGKAEKYHTKRENGNYIIYIGEKKALLNPGIYTYEISYHTYRQIGFFEDYDELYWNVTGNDWVFPIDKVTAQVKLPPSVKIIQNACYTGNAGSTNTNCQVIPLSSSTLAYVVENLQPYQGLTVATGFTKGIIKEPKIPGVLKTNNLSGILLGIAALLLVLTGYLWNRFGRDHEPPTVYPQLEVPNNLSPASMGFLHTGKYSQNMLAASLIDLAVKGYIRINEPKKKGLFAKKHFTLQKLKEAEESLAAEEKALLNEFFKKDQDEITIDGEYSNQIQKTVIAYQAILAKENRPKLKKGNNWSKVLWMFLGVSVVYWSILLYAHSKIYDDQKMFIGAALYGGALLVFLLIIGVRIKVAKFIWVLPVLFAGGAAFWYFAVEDKLDSYALIYLFLIGGVAILALFNYLIRQPSVELVAQQSRINGFKMYLETAETELIKFYNPPQITPEVFEKYLPYALILGVDGIWGKKFEKSIQANAYTYQNNWYAGNSTVFSSSMTQNLSKSLSSTVSSSSVSPSSSGSGGGGSSGGGGGGGGGGGW